MSDLRSSYTISGLSNKDIHVGHPFGRVAILWHSSLDSCIRRVPSNHNCCIAVTIQTNNCVTLLINVYALTDAQTPIPSNNLFDLLDAVEIIIESVQYDALLARDCGTVICFECLCTVLLSLNFGIDVTLPSVVPI